MKIILATVVVVVTFLLIVAQTWATPNDPFSFGDYGPVMLLDGSTEAAAMPAVTFDNYDEVIGKLNIVHYTIGELPGGGVQIIINQCGGADAALADARPFLFFGNVSQYIVCGN